MYVLLANVTVTIFDEFSIFGQLIWRFHTTNNIYFSLLTYKQLCQISDLFVTSLMTLQFFRQIFCDLAAK
jgi:hypothetical protein